MNLAMCVPALAASLVPSANIASPDMGWPGFEESHITWIDVFETESLGLSRWICIDDLGADVVSQGDVLDLFEAGSARSIELLAEARELTELQDGWDGAGSSGASDVARVQFLAAIDSLPAAAPIPRTSVTSNGDLLLYWDERDFFLDMEFEQDGNVSFFARRKHGDEREFKEFSSIAEAIPALSQFLKKLSA